jgi:hypothetical protein
MLLIELQLPRFKHALSALKNGQRNSVKKAKNFPAKAARPRQSSSDYARFQAYRAPSSGRSNQFEQLR